MSYDDTKGASANAESGDKQFIAPVIGSITASGSATLNTLNQLSVSMAYNDKYDVLLSAEDSVLLRDAIVLSGDSSDFTANLAVGHSLQSVLETVITSATKAGGGTTLKEELGNDLRAKFDSVFNNGLSNILDAATLEYDVQHKAAATSMVGKLLQPACETIAQQIPKDHYNAWSNASDAANAPEDFTGSGLPLLDDDVIVFVFNMEAGLTVARTEVKVPGATDDVVAQPDGINTIAADGKFTTTKAGTATYMYEPRRIAFFVQVQGVNPAGYVAPTGS